MERPLTGKPTKDHIPLKHVRELRAVPARDMGRSVCMPFDGNARKLLDFQTSNLSNYSRPHTPDGGSIFLRVIELMLPTLRHNAAHCFTGISLCSSSCATQVVDELRQPHCA